MDTKLKRSKMVVGFVSWFAGIIILAVNLLGLLAEMGCYGNFTEHVKEVVFGDFQDTEEFRDHVLNHMGNFLSMSVAEDLSGKSGTSYWDMEDWGTEADDMEASGVPEDLQGGLEPWEEGEQWEEWEQEMGIAAEESDAAMDMYSTDNYPLESSGRTYYYYDYFNDVYGDRYDVIYRDLVMSGEEADEIHNRLRYNMNILYRVENKGQVLYTNYANLGEPGEGTVDYYSVNIDSGVDGEAFRFAPPEGYNFILYYDGKTLRVWKNGSEKS